MRRTRGSVYTVDSRGVYKLCMPCENEKFSFLNVNLEKLEFLSRMDGMVIKEICDLGCFGTAIG